MIARSVARDAVPVKLPTNPPVDVVTPATVILPIPACPSTSRLPRANIFPVNVVTPVLLICILSTLLVAILK